MAGEIASHALELLFCVIRRSPWLGFVLVLPLIRRKVTRGDCSRWNTFSKTQTKQGYAPVAGTFGPSGPIEVRSSTCAAGT